jgi:RNA polymerase sigma-70 factor (ECF subfamily)
MAYTDDDIQLMLRFQNGDEFCFEQLVNRHKNHIFNLAYRFLGNHQEAEDISQQTFIKVYQAKKYYQPKAKFTTWLYIICKNTCLQHLRQRKHPFFYKILRLEKDDVAGQIIDSRTSSPLESILKDELSEVVKLAVHSLPSSQKLAVILYRYEGLPYEQIAEIIGCSTKAVKSLLHRAKLSLKEKLTDYVKA